MSIKPLLFNTEMVCALLDGRKSVTRRVVKGLPLCEPHATVDEDRLWIEDEYGEFHPAEAYSRIQPGDILYVREKFACDGFDGEKWCYVYWTDVDDCGRVVWGNLDKGEWAPRSDYHWRPSIHMPREAARIWLRVTNVRVERLQEIADEQAQAEGVRYTDFGMYQPSWKASLDGGKTFHPAKPIHHPGYHVKDVTKPEQCFPSARGAFSAFWDSTIKPADRERYGWAANPWVWVIEFERCKKPEEWPL